MGGYVLEESFVNFSHFLSVPKLPDHGEMQYVSSYTPCPARVRMFSPKSPHVQDTGLVKQDSGSGIGPCLSFLDDENRPALKLLWQIRAPLKTYGQQPLDLVRRIDPEPVIMVTRESGGVDMLLQVLNLCETFELEAFCVISNHVMTK